MGKDAVDSHIGKHVLVGITYVDHDETFIEQKQWHGVIVRINNEEIVVRLENGDEEHSLPPDLNAIEPAPKGEYRLRSTGEVVTNPDFLATWTVVKPERK